MLRHARYVISENSVTGFAFTLFLAIVLAALVGPYIVPYDPFMSDTAATLKPPSLAHWFGTDQLGRDVFSRVVVATRLDFFIAVALVALVFLMGGLAGLAAGVRRLDRPHRRPHLRHHHGLSPVCIGHGNCRRTRRHRRKHHSRHGDREFSALRPCRAGRSQCTTRGRFRTGSAVVR